MKSLWESLCGRIKPHFPLILVLSLSFASFLIAPWYMSRLRHQLASGLPEEWSRVTNNGPYAEASGLIVTARNIEEGIYANKVVQIVRYGFPYDPYTGDRSLKSWILDCLMFYPIAIFVLIAGGSIHYGWILAHATLGTLWVLFFYKIFRYWSEDSVCSLIFATFGFFFLDCLMWIFFRVIPS